MHTFPEEVLSDECLINIVILCTCRYIRATVAACPAYVQSKGASSGMTQDQGSEDVDNAYHYVPPQNIQVFIMESRNR